MSLTFLTRIFETHSMRLLHKYMSHIRESWTTHEEDHTQNIWISKSTSFPDKSIDGRGLHLLTWKLVQFLGDSRENVFDVYGTYRENFVRIFRSRNRLKSNLLCPWCESKMRLFHEFHEYASLFSLPWICKSFFSSMNMRVFFGPWPETHSFYNEYVWWDWFISKLNVFLNHLFLIKCKCVTWTLLIHV